MSERDQPTIDAANELLRTTMTAAIHLPLADGKSAYLGSDSDIALMLQNKDQSSAAVRGEAVAALVPKFAGQFDTFQEWVNKAQSRLASPEHRRAICVDAKGRRMTCGADFMKARDDGDFPVRYFWECELAPAAQWACHDCGNSQQFDHRGCIKPVSARAADAPSEPSDVAMLRQALIDLHHAIQFAHDSLGGGIHTMPTMLHQPGTVTEFIENVLCSTSAHNPECQLGNTSWNLVPSEPTEAMLRSAISYREVDANDEIQDPVLSILDRQYRAMLAAADALDSQPTDAAMALLREVADMRDIAETFASGAQVSDEFDALRDRIVAFLASSQPTDGGVRNGNG